MIKKEKWLLYLFLDFLTLGFFTFYIAKRLNVYTRGKWYSKTYLWVLGFLCGIIPGLIMFTIFYVQSGVLVSKKLSVPYCNLYGYPYIWIICLIIPIIGWTLFFILLIYTHLWYIIYIKRGYSEKL